MGLDDLRRENPSTFGPHSPTRALMVTLMALIANTMTLHRRAIQFGGPLPGGAGGQAATVAEPPRAPTHVDCELG